MAVAIQAYAVAVLSWAAASTSAVSQDVRVYLIDIEEPVRLETTRTVARALELGERGGAAAVILRLTAPGGSIEAAQLIVQELAAAVVPVFAFVTSPTWGASALIALAADSLFMGPQSSIGAADSLTEPWRDVPPEAVDDLRETFEQLIARRGLDPRIGAALVDPSVSMAGVVDSHEVLALSPDDALRLGVAHGQADDLQDVLTQLGLHELPFTTIDAGWLGTTVNVVNRNFREIVVYVARSGTRFRLGMVTSMHSEQFDVPGDFLVPGSVIRIVAEVVGSTESTDTEEIRVEPGLVIDWVIENEIIHSNYFVYIRY